MNKRVLKFIRETSKQLPSELLDNVMKEEKTTPTLEKLASKVADSTENKTKKERFKNLLDSGQLSKTHQVVDKKIQKKIDQWWEEQIKQAVKDGRIPDPKKDEDIKKYKKKLWKHAKKLKKN